MHDQRNQYPNAKFLVCRFRASYSEAHNADNARARVTSNTAANIEQCVRGITSV